MRQETIERIRALIGPATPEQMAYVESHVTDKVGLFLPLGGACQYAIQPDHTHPSWMFTISYDGKTSLKIGDATIVVPPKALFAVAPGILHTELPSDAPPNYPAIFIQPRFLKEQQRRFGGTTPLPHSHTWVNASSRITDIARNLILELDGREPGYEPMVEALTAQLAQLLLRNLERGGEVRSDSPKILNLELIAAYVSANLSRSITVGELARQSGRSQADFARLFRQKTGMSPSAFVSEFRMKAAKRMLLQSAKSPTEIAYECGFSSSAHFSHRFSKALGETPNTYRKRLGV